MGSIDINKLIQESMASTMEGGQEVVQESAGVDAPSINDKLADALNESTSSERRRQHTLLGSYGTGGERGKNALLAKDRESKDREGNRQLLAGRKNERPGSDGRDNDSRMHNGPMQSDASGEADNPGSGGRTSITQTMRNAKDYLADKASGASEVISKGVKNVTDSPAAKATLLASTGLLGAGAMAKRAMAKKAKK